MSSFVLITIGLLASAITLGFILTWAILNTDLFKKYSIQHKNYPKDHFQKRLPLISFNLFNLFFLTGLGLYFMQDHRYMHINTWLYQKIHLKHHQATAPLPIEFIYNHPFEWMGGTPGLILAYIIIYQFCPINAYAFWAYSLFRNLHELDIHSGLKSSIGQYIPFWGTVEHHDFHHSKVKGNYASTFTIWDKIFGTEVGEKTIDER
jgi:sterol desaturase/sphingolipid hydroxylase (fatty acid hydroxylase superfamily)